MGQVKSSTLGRLFGGAELDAHIDRLEARLAELGGRQAELEARAAAAAAAEARLDHRLPIERKAEA